MILKLKQKSESHSAGSTALKRTSLKSVFGLVTLLVFSMLALPSLALADSPSCSVNFPRGVQNHDTNGYVDFLFNGQSHDNPDKYIDTKNLYKYWLSWQKTCGSENCSKTNNIVPALTLPAFKTSTAQNDEIHILGETLTLGNDTVEFHDVFIGLATEITLAERQAPYMIKNLTMGVGGTLLLSPGEYWVENFFVLGISEIKVVGNGTARLFVKNNLTVVGATSINANGTADQLAIIGYDDIDIGIWTLTKAVIYAKDFARVGADSIHEGAISAKNIIVGIAADSYYKQSAVQSLDLGELCGGSGFPDMDGDGIPDDVDPDIDGDGFNNDVEEDAGTDPRDPNSFPDQVAPSLVIANENPQTIENENLTVTGTVTDTGGNNPGVASVVLTSDMSPGNFTATITGDQFSVVVPVVFGSNVLSITATDNSGNTTIESMTANRVDETAPELNLDNPAQETVQTQSVIVAGTAFDVAFGQGLDKVEISSDRFPSGTVQATVLDDLFSESINLAFGLNIIEVKAIDLAGNERLMSIEVTRVDLTAPTVVIVAPANNTSLEAVAVTVLGTLSDDVNGSGINAVVATSSQFPSVQYPVTLTGVNFSVDIPLIFGATSIVISAQDNSANVGQAVVNVARVDVTAPTLNLTSTTQTTELHELLIEGSAFDEAIGKGLDKLEITSDQNASVITATMNGNAFSGMVELAFGANVITAKAIDLAGNETTQSITVTREDQTPPTLTISTPTQTIEAHQLLIEGSAFDEVNGEGLDKVEITSDQNANVITATMTGDAFSGTVDLAFGANLIIVKAIDLAGNEITQSITLTREDQTPPSLTITTPTQTTEAHQLLIEGSAFDELNGKGLDKVEITSDQNANVITATMTGNAFSGTVDLAFGANMITAKAVDLAGNETTLSITITREDQTPPTISINTTAAQTDDTSVLITGIVQDNSYGEGIDKVELTSDQHADVVVATLVGENFSGNINLLFGNNIITATAYDLAGNQSITQVTVERVDTVAPTLSLDTHPAQVEAIDITLSGSVSDNANGLGVDRLEASVPGSQDVLNATINAGLYTVTLPLGFGDNTITLSAYDLAGNQSDVVTQVTRVDLTAPTLNLTNLSQTTELHQLLIEGSAFDDAIGKGLDKIEITTDQNASVITASMIGTAYTGTVDLAFGANVLTVKAIDLVGNETARSITVTREDQTPPTISINTTAAQTDDTSVLIAGIVQDNTYGEGIDKVELTSNQHAGVVLATLVGETFSGNINLLFGNNIITASAYDLAGNQTITQVTVERVDTIAPTLSLDTHAAQVEALDITLSGSVSDNANGLGIDRLEASVSGSQGVLNAAINAGFYTVTLPLGFGDNTITLSAYDLAGNQSDVVTQVTRVDLTEPSLTIATPAQTTELHQLLIEGSAFDDAIGEGIDRIEMSSDQNANVITATLNGNDFSGLVDLAFGANIITAKAIDLAGNETTQSITVTREDQTPPTISINTTAAQTDDTNVLIAGIVQDNAYGEGIDKVELSSDQHANVVVASLVDENFSGSINLVFGNNIITATAYDKAGNQTSAQVSVERVDTIAPTLTLDAHLAEIEATEITLTGSVSDNANGLGFDKLEASVSTQPGVIAATVNAGLYSVTVPLSFGDNEITLSAYDLAGNQSDVVTQVARVDLTIPTLVGDVLAAQTDDTQVSVSGTVTDNVDGQGIDRVDISDSQSPPTQQTANLSGDQYSSTFDLVFGTNTFTISAFDLSGNTVQITQSISRVDLTPPSLTVDSQTLETDEPSTTISGSAIDDANGQGVERVEIIDTTNGGSQTNAAALTGDLFSANQSLAFGLNTFTVKAYDIAGNVSESSLSITRVDQTPPTLTVDNDAASVVGAPTANVSGTVIDDVNGMGIQKVELVVANVSGNVTVQASLSGGTYTVGINLAAGINTVTVRAFDLAQNTSTPIAIQITRPDQDGDGIPDDIDPDRDGDDFDNDVETAAGTDPDNAADYPDIVDPVLVINTPAQNIEATEINIVATVSDAGGPRAGIESISASSDRYTGLLFNASNTNGSVDSLVPLSLGDNLITLIATDFFANTTSATVLIKRVSPPRFVNVSPADGSVVQTPIISIAGQVTTDQNLNTVSFFINEWQITPDGSQTSGVYPFTIDNIPVEIGLNTFVLKTVSVDGSATETINITYIPDNAADIPAPVLSLLAPNAGAILKDESFSLVGEVESFAGKVNVLINGEPVSLANDYHSHFEYLLSFPENASSLVVNISATDQLDKVSNVQATYYRDGTAPQISIPNLSEQPALNPAIESPTVISGTVTDENLANLSVNGQALHLFPGLLPDQYDFDLSVSLSAGEQRALDFVARDISGNESTKSYLLQSTAQASIKVIQPQADQQYISEGLAFDIDVIAKVGSLSAGDQVTVAIDGGTATVIAVDDLVSGIAVGVIQLPATTVDHLLTFEVLSSSSEVIATTTSAISVLDSNDVPVSLVRFEPENGARDEEVGRVVELYFNKPIDVSKLSVVLKENFQGKTYVTDAELGDTPLDSTGFALQDVTRVNEELSGALSVLPGNTQMTYTVSSTYAYGAELNVDVLYDGESLEHFYFNVRELPTFINGEIKDHFNQPLAGVEVSLPTLNRSAITNKDGRYDFGYAEAADKKIAGGSYKISINANSAYPGFGSYIGFVDITESRRNNLPPIKLQELNRDEPYLFVKGGELASLSDGDLKVDLTDADLFFPDGQTSGGVHTQFLSMQQSSVRVRGPFSPKWVFANQPRGIEVVGPIQLDLFLPKNNGSYRYLPPGLEYMLILGFDESVGRLTPIGVGKIINGRVVSQGVVNVSSFDFFALSTVIPEMNALMQSVGEGEQNLLEVERVMQSYFNNPSEQLSGEQP